MSSIQRRFLATFAIAVLISTAIQCRGRPAKWLRDVGQREPLPDSQSATAAAAPPGIQPRMSPPTSGAASPQRLPQFRRITDDLISFSIPSDWQRLDSSGEQTIRRQIESQLREQIPKGLTRFMVFTDTGWTPASVMLEVCEVPPGVADYLQIQRKHNEEFLRQSKATGTVQEVYADSAAKVNGVRVLVMDTKMRSGRRAVAVQLCPPHRKSTGVVLSVSCPAEQYRSFKPMIDSVIGSIRFPEN